MRRAYKKPQIKKVRLAPQEAVLTGCKQTMDHSGGNRRCRENNCLNKSQGS